MQVTREELNPCTVQLAVVCDPNEVHEGYERAIKQISKKTKLPGFRPGHAPRAMVEGLISPAELNETAAEAIVNDIYKVVIEKEALEPEPTLRPVVELKEIEREPAKCAFNLKVSLPPVVDLGEYKGLKVDVPAIEVTNEEIDYHVEELRKRHSTQAPVTDRTIQEGDVCVVNVKQVGEAGDGRNFMTTVGQTFPELDELLVGSRAEEMKVAKLKFPKTFREKDWAGKELEVQITVNSVSAVSLPELNEDFAKTYDSENIDDLKERFRAVLLERKEEAVNELLTDKLLDELLTKSTVHVPDGMWETLAERRLMETAEQQREEGKSLEQYAQENGMTLESLIQAWKDKAKILVVRALLIREIFKQEDMRLSTEDLNIELLKMAREYQAPPAEILELLRKSNSLEELHFRAISRRVSEFLVANRAS